MRIFGKTLVAVFLLFALPSTPDILSIKIRSDNRPLILFSKFEYSHSGYVSVSISSVGISTIPATSNYYSSHEPNLSRIGFFLISHKLSKHYDLEFKRNPNLCPLDIKNITLLFTFQNLSSPPESDQSSFNRSYNVTYPGLYSLYFANCNNQSLVTMDVRTELCNTDINDGGIITKDYLSADQPQPFLYFKFFLIYLCFLGFWLKLLSNNQQCIKMIHLVMYVLLCVTVFYFICAVGDQHNLKVTGTHHHVWRVLFYIFQSMRDVVFYTVIVLIGWCFWKKVLLPRWEILILTIVILLRVWVNVCYIMVGESGPPYNEEDWVDSIKDMIIEIDGICCMVVVMYTCLGLTVTMATDHTSSSSSFVWSFTSARPHVFAYVGFLYLVILQLDLIAVAQEIYSLVFYMVVFYMYRPSVVDDDDEGEKSKAFLV